jgi:glycosyltransferase involved in cell wall biosynthesis
MDSTALRILHLNSLLTGGGTDDQCVKLAAELHRMGQRVWLAGPGGSAFAPVIEKSGVPFVDTGPRRTGFILRAARLIRGEGVEIVHGHHGRDIWPVIVAARLAGTRPKIVLTRHLAKSPASWASRRFLLGRCDVMIAVSEFVAKVLREGVYEADSPEAERRARPPLHGDKNKIRVIYGGIDTKRFQPAPAPERRLALGLERGSSGLRWRAGMTFPGAKASGSFSRRRHACRSGFRARGS